MADNQKGHRKRRDVGDDLFSAEIKYRVFRTLVTGVVTVILIYFSHRSIAILAGQETIAEIGLTISITTKRMIVSALIGFFGAAGIGYGTIQKLLYARKVKRLTDRIKELERRIDPGRQSSKD